MIIVIDNYDSFTWNLVQAFEAAGARLDVIRNDQIDRGALEDRLDRAAAERVSGIVVSPGPGSPASAGVSMDAIQVAVDRELPLLGVCLGHQCLAAALGGRVVRAPSLVHGEASQVRHDGAGLLHGLASPFPAARYHSLCVDEGSLPAELEVTARADDGVVMAMRHRSLPIEGVQFHPESVLTPEGPRLLANFLRLIGEGDPAVLEGEGSATFAMRGLPAAGSTTSAPAMAGSAT